ncbi:MAG: hypothetical protein WD448_11270 [Woeseia sp.]
MSTLNTWMKRFRSMGQYKPREHVLMRDRFEVLTSTQACRFKELQHIHLGRQGNVPKDLPHYALSEASARLNLSVDRILLSAAAGDLECYVLAAQLRGQWRIGGRDALELHHTEAFVMPRYLALKAVDCREIEAYGSANVFELEYPATSDSSISEFGERTRFQLLEPLWVDPERIVLRHPLPVLDAARTGLPRAGIDRQSGSA